MRPPAWTPHAKAALRLARGVHQGAQVLGWRPARGTVRTVCPLEDGRVLFICNTPEPPRVLLSDGTLHVLRCGVLARTTLQTATSTIAWDGELVVAHGACVSWYNTRTWKADTMPLASGGRKVQKLCCFDPRSPLFALCGSHAYMMLPATRVFRMVMSCCSVLDVTPCKNGWVARHACVHDNRTCVARYAWQSPGCVQREGEKPSAPCMVVDRVQHIPIKTAVLPMFVQRTVSGDVVIVRVDGSIQLLDRDDRTSSIVLPMRVKLPQFHVVGDVIFGASECFDTGFRREARVRLATRAWGGKGQQSLALQSLLQDAHHRDALDHPCAHPYRNMYAVSPDRGVVVDRQGDEEKIHMLW